MNARPLLVLLAAVSACKVIEAPDTVEEMMNFGFVHFADEDEELLVDLSFNLSAFVDAHIDEAEKGWGVNSLSAEDLDAAGVEQTDTEDIVGASASAAYTHEIDDVALAITFPDKTEVFDHVLEYAILSETDLDCFLAHKCDTYTFEVDQTAKASILGQATQTVGWEFRWIDADPEPVFAMRTLCPDGIEFSSNLIAVPQQYSFAMVYDTPEGSRRMEAFWAETKMLSSDANLPEGMAVNMTINQMQKSAELIDEWLDGREQPAE